MNRICQRCGTDFPARSSRATFCGDRCRNAAGYARRSGAAPSLPVLSVAPPLPASDDDNPERGSLARRAWLDLSGYGEDATVVGLLTLVLARAIDSGAYSGSGLTALAREFSRLWSEVRAAHRIEDDNPLSVMRRRRERDRESGSPL